MAGILVVDDDPQIRTLVSRWLTEWHYPVRTVGSAAAALEAMLVEQADVLLCDVRMPGRDGLWLAERVKARWPDTALVMVTGADDFATIHRSRDLGAVDFVSKPFNRHFLQQALERAAAARPSRN